MPFRSPPSSPDTATDRKPWVKAAMQVADVLASWSWWKFAGVSLLILIVGSMLDSYLVPPVRHAASGVGGKSAVYRHEQAPGRVGDGNSVVIRSRDSTAASESGHSVRIDIGAQDVRIDGLDPAHREEIHKALEDLEKWLDQLDDAPQVRDAVSEVSWGAGMGWREEPFVGLAKLLVVSLLILKVMGSSKRREQTAQAAVAVAEWGRESARLEQELAEARLRQIQTQIEPHFLFNTLAALQQLIASQPAKAAEMNRHLIDWLRSGLQQMRQEQSTLAEEEQLLGDYLHIMKVRMDDRLQWQIRFAPELREVRIPSLLLQPLVENAITHGLEPLAAGGSIDIHAQRMGNQFEVIVEDNGVGFQSGASNPVGHGLGLDSVRNRLRLRYGDAASLRITAREGGGTRVTLKLPWLG